ncbi:hypothetical protein ABK040_011436 [Willaertia magna]
MWQKYYVQLHNEALTKKLLINNNNYLIYRCHQGCGGLGDRLLGIVTSLYIALLTDRVLLIDFPNPAELSQILQPNLIKWNFTDPQFKALINAFPSQYTHNEIDIQENEGKRRFFQEHDFLYSYQFRKVEIVKFNQRMYYYMHLNPKYNEKRRLLGLDRMHPFHIFGCFFHFLFKPHSDLIAMMDNLFVENQLVFSENTVSQQQPLVESKQLKTLTAFPLNLNSQLPPPHMRTVLIGIQIRTGGNWNDPLRIKEEDVQIFWNCAQHLMKKYEKEGFKVKYFLTTDNTIVKKEAIKLFGKKKLITMNTPIVHIERSSYNENNNLESFKSTVVEYLILSLCDELIITRSNFGETASMIGFKSRIKLPQDNCQSFLSMSYSPIYEFSFINEKENVWYSA